MPTPLYLAQMKRLYFQNHFLLLLKLLWLDSLPVSCVPDRCLYPFPAKALQKELKGYEHAEIIWCQEEPRNMGSWNYVNEWIEDALIGMKHKKSRPVYVGRDAAASPATGLMSRHKAEQEKLVNTALGGKK